MRPVGAGGVKPPIQLGNALVKMMRLDEALASFRRAVALKRSVVTASRWQVRQAMSTSSVGRWRNYERYLGPLAALSPDSGVPAK